MDRNTMLGLFALGFVYVFATYLLTLGAFIHHLRVEHEKTAVLIWLLSPVIVPFRVVVVPVTWLLVAASLIVVTLVGGPVYFLFARPLQRLAAFLALKAAQLREALRSIEAFEKYYAGFIRFGERLLLYRDVLPHIVSDKLPERPLSGAPSRPTAGSKPAPCISSRTAAARYIRASQMGPAGD